MVYYFIVRHLDDEKYDKFLSKDENEPVTLWKNIKDNYASSSSENIASSFGKLFSIKFPSSSSSLSESISLFRSTLKLLHTLSPTLFTGDIMPQVSTKIPTVEEVFEEVKLDIIQRSSSEEDDNVALKFGTKTKKELCHKGKHNPLLNHSESECFQLHPEKHEAYHKRRNNHLTPGMGVSLAACNSSGHLSNQPILDSGCSNTIAPTNRGFLNTTRSKETLLAANGNSMEVVSEGTLFLKTSIGNLSIQNALVVPSVSCMLVSLGPYLNNGATLKGYKGGANLYNKHGKLIFTTKIVNNVLLINNPSPGLACSAISGNPLTLHKRLGHQSLSKSHCLPFSGTFLIPTQTLEVIHMDLCGPITPISHGGNKYIFQLIDGFSHMRFVYLLKEKADSYHSFLKFQSLVKNQTSNTIKILVPDNGGEFVYHKFSSLFSSKGIKHLTTAPYTPQKNPVSEWGNRMLFEQIRVFLCNYKVPLEWWREACSMAAFVLNQTPIASINYFTPISLWDPLKARNILDLHPFGCTAIMHCSKENRKSKVDTSGICCMLIGIKEGHKNFHLFEPKSKNIYITHDCIFLDCEAFWPNYRGFFQISLLFGTKGTHHPPCPDDSPFSEVPTIIQPLEEEQSCPEDNNSLPPPNVPKGWTFDLVPDEAPKNIESTISSKKIILGKHQAQPPSHFSGAKEFSSLERHGVLEEVTRTNDLWLLSTTWVFREKTDAHGNLLEEKAPLCVRGFLQVEGLDFHDIFAPTGCLGTLHFLLGYCAEKDLDLHQMDVKTAFLHGDLNEVIHISLPEGYQPSGSANPCFVFIHVDNLVIGNSNLNSFQVEINSTFDMKDLGELRFVLGMKVTRNRNFCLIFLTQELYVNKILHTFKMSDCQPPSSSLEPVSSDLNSGQVSINFRKAIGLLNYLVTCTQPGLAFSASQ
ncbi:hypothetical protein O181_000838 [Austropuccinia psidii MF-1]|uniref:Integrase catalytic domain-containing protein n=1 Tax=Austropuccinia psidii MF-1 TaxID=1389203 RepID=A0A9Q3GB73_9BASI|nr:hypothetical protein [Austropuccinia psidii MF-1]